jgi:hypothetical protein
MCEEYMIELIEITGHQLEVLTRISNGAKKKVFATYASTDVDGQARELVDKMFAEDKALVEMGLLFDVTSYPKHQEVSDGYMKEEGRALRILAPSAIVKFMFKHTAWEGWVN